jgi:hypothetical protein
MSIDRQYGMHEIPGTEAAAPAMRPDVAGLERQINRIWAKLAEHDERIAELGSRGRPLLVSDDGGEARGRRERIRPPSSPRPRPAPAARPWEAEGVSKATWYRRQREAAP